MVGGPRYTPNDALEEVVKQSDWHHWSQQSGARDPGEWCGRNGRTARRPARSGWPGRRIARIQSTTRLPLGPRPLRRSGNRWAQRQAAITTCPPPQRAEARTAHPCPTPNRCRAAARRSSGQLGDIPIDATPPHRLVEHLGEDRANPLDRGDSKSLIDLLRDEAVHIGRPASASSGQAPVGCGGRRYSGSCPRHSGRPGAGAHPNTSDRGAGPPSSGRRELPARRRPGAGAPSSSERLRRGYGRWPTSGSDVPGSPSPC